MDQLEPRRTIRIRTWREDYPVLDLIYRCAGIAFLIWLLYYMVRCCMAGQYLKGDVVLSVIALMAYTMGTVLAVFCTAVSWKNRKREEPGKK